LGLLDDPLDNYIVYVENCDSRRSIIFIFLIIMLIILII